MERIEGGESRNKTVQRMNNRYFFSCYCVKLPCTLTVALTARALLEFVFFFSWDEIQGPARGHQARERTPSAFCYHISALLPPAARTAGHSHQYVLISPLWIPYLRRKRLIPQPKRAQVKRTTLTLIPWSGCQYNPLKRSVDGRRASRIPFKTTKKKIIKHAKK